MTKIVLDVLLVVILGFCTWQGYRKRLVLAAVGILVLLLAIFGGSYISDRYADDFEERINPLVGWVSDEAVDEAMRQNGYKVGALSDRVICQVAAEAFVGMGVVQPEAEKLAELALEDIKENDVSLKTGISNAFIHAVCRVLLFMFVFAVVALILTLLAHFLSMLLKMPKIKKLDTYGGLAAGFIYGLLLLSSIGWMLRFLGILVPQQIINDTVFLRLLVNKNLLAAFL